MKHSHELHVIVLDPTLHRPGVCTINESLVGALEHVLFFQKNWEFHYPNCYSHSMIFQRGSSTTNQMIIHHH